MLLEQGFGAAEGTRREDGGGVGGGLGLLLLLLLRLLAVEDGTEHGGGVGFVLRVAHGVGLLFLGEDCADDERCEVVGCFHRLVKGVGGVVGRKESL